jgi:hypothetical protein
VGLVLHAVDGTKIVARASRRTATHKADLEKELRKVDENIDRLMNGIEASEREEQGEYRLPEEFTKQEQLRDKIKAALEEMKEAGTKDYHPKEPDTRMIECGGRREFAYNAQAVVDGDSGLIIATEVVNNADDHSLLVPMIEKVEAELGRAAEETVADGGYRSAAELRRAEERGYSVLVNLGRQAEEVKGAGEYHPSKFRYDKERDCCVCPRGEILKFHRLTTSGQYKYPVRDYRCKSFRECPVRWECSQSKGGRRIELSIYHDSILRQREKQRQQEKRSALRRRMVINEPVFGYIKQGFGFRRWTVGGLESVRTQWSLICTTVNLAKLHRLWLSGELIFDRT